MSTSRHYEIDALRHRLIRLGLPALILLTACPATRGQPETRAIPADESAESLAGAPLVRVADYQMFEERYGAAAVADGDFLYIIGGRNTYGTCLDSIERFDTRTGKSKSFGLLQIGRYRPGAVLVGQKIYVLGGFSHPLPHPTNPCEASVEIFDLATRKTAQATAMPVARAGFACALLDGRIYAIGGEKQQGDRMIDTATTDVYDVATDKWTTGVPLPAPRQVVAAVADGRILVAGGYSGYTSQIAVANVESFNSRDQTWQILPPLGQPVAANAVAVLGHRLFLFGNDVPSAHVVIYDLQTSKSASRPLQFTPVRYPAAAVHDGRIYVVGGILHGHTVVSDIQVYEPGKGG
jgi:hypothetical protein